ncbi:MAG: DHH family phosphoesterase, partial [Nitrososphaerota archaeon]|nr:DHH family phosphoesterase [Nitrososphaerota archaeon]
MAPDAGTKGFPFAEIGTLHRAAVVCHRNADADSYLSAFAIARLIESLAPECEVIIGTPGGMTTLTQKLSARFKHAAAAKGDGDFDLYVAVDVGDEELLGDWKGKMASSAGVRVLVDHHPARATRLYDRAVVDEAATSAAEVAFGIY